MEEQHPAWTFPLGIQQTITQRVNDISFVEPNPFKMNVLHLIKVYSNHGMLYAEEKRSPLKFFLNVGNYVIYVVLGLLCFSEAP